MGDQGSSDGRRGPCLRQRPRLSREWSVRLRPLGTEGRAPVVLVGTERLACRGQEGLVEGRAVRERGDELHHVLLAVGLDEIGHGRDARVGQREAAGPGRELPGKAFEGESGTAAGGGPHLGPVALPVAGGQVTATLVQPSRRVAVGVGHGLVEVTSSWTTSSSTQSEPTCRGSMSPKNVWICGCASPPTFSRVAGPRASRNWSGSE